MRLHNPGTQQAPTASPAPEDAPYLPERVSLLREELKVLVGQLHGGQGLQFQVGPALHELGQVHKGVRA